MPLVVEDGSASDPDANGYITVAEVDAYFLERGITAWAGTSDAKEAYIIQGADYLEYAYTWKGVRITDEQPMQWPRVVDGSDSLDGISDPTTVPKEVKRANAELALLAMSGELMPAQTGGNLTSESISIAGAVTESKSYAGGGGNSTERRFPKVDRIVAKWATGGSSGVRGVPIERA